MRLLVILALDPHGQASVQGREAGGVAVAELGDQLGATGPEEALDFAFSLGLERSGVDQRDTEFGADQRKLVGAIIGAVVDVMCRVRLCGLSR
jgi:hypothetical protein